MIWWTISFLLGLPQEEGKTGKREVATWVFLAWCYGFWKLGHYEAQGVPMTLTADVLRLTLPFAVAGLAGAFGMHQMLKAGWKPGGGE
ncbi:MAG: hypothetical protein AAGF53_02365 [Pseudomonadota bacterium]